MRNGQKRIKKGCSGNQLGQLMEQIDELFLSMKEC
jgi:hypothetical protein